MFVIGKNEYDLISFNRSLFSDGTFKITNVRYNIMSHISPSIIMKYEDAICILSEIKDHYDEISFTNESVIDSIINEQKYNVCDLKIFELVPTKIINI